MGSIDNSVELEIVDGLSRLAEELTTHRRTMSSLAVLWCDGDKDLDASQFDVVQAYRALQAGNKHLVLERDSLKARVELLEEFVKNIYKAEVAGIGEPDYEISVDWNNDGLITIIQGGITAATGGDPLEAFYKLKDEKLICEVCHKLVPSDSRFIRIGPGKIVCESCDR